MAAAVRLLPLVAFLALAVATLAQPNDDQAAEGTFSARLSEDDPSFNDSLSGGSEQERVGEPQPGQRTPAEPAEPVIDDFYGLPDEEYAELARARAEHEIWRLRHIERAFDWHHFGTYLIFLLVVTIVAAGLYFSWIQFKSGQASDAVNQFKVSKEGIEISSPILGLVILVISLLFFYLYIEHVYPLKNEANQSQKIP